MPKESLLSSMPKLILAVVLIVCIGAVMGLMGLMMTKKQMRVETPKKITEDETTDWQTYRNEKFGFEFRYPQKIEYKNGPKKVSLDTIKEVPYCAPEDIIEFGRGDKTECCSMVLFNALSSLGFVIKIKEKPADFINLQNYVEKISKRIQEETKMAAAPSVVESRSVNINDREGFLVKVNRRNATEYKHEYIYLEKDKYIYIISYDYLNYFINSESKDYDFDQKLKLNKTKEILSTFKFIEKDETADWQTYRNEEYGFEVEYKSNFWTLKKTELEVGYIPANLYSKNDNCRIVLGVGGHGLPFDWTKATEEIFIDGKNAQKQIWKDGNNDIGLVEVLFQGGYGLELYLHPDNQQDCIDEFNQILSAFKFIEK